MYANPSDLHAGQTKAAKRNRRQRHWDIRTKPFAKLCYGLYPTERNLPCAQNVTYFLSLFAGGSAYFRSKKSQNKVYVNAEQPFPRIVAKQGFT